MAEQSCKLGRCRLCGSPDCRPLFQKAQYEIAKCNPCGFIFLNFEPSREFLAAYYSEDFFTGDTTKHGFSNYDNEVKSLQRTFADRVELLRRYHRPEAVLDVGCATGLFMEVAAKYWKVSGVEISAYASERARAKGLDVFTGALEDSPHIHAAFDLVTLWDTIEHVADPVKTIRQIGRIVKPGGVIALTTGDVRSFTARISGRFWHLYNVPQHLSFFDQRSIARLLGAGGFNIVAIRYPSMQLTIDYLLFRLVTFYHLRYALPLYNWFSRRRLADCALPINLFDIMLVIAVKS